MCGAHKHCNARVALNARWQDNSMESMSVCRFHDAFDLGCRCVCFCQKENISRSRPHPIFSSWPATHVSELNSALLRPVAMCRAHHSVSHFRKGVPRLSWKTWASMHRRPQAAQRKLCLLRRNRRLDSTRLEVELALLGRCRHLFRLLWLVSGRV
eukprot:6490488-Amphidinium_carterae.3